MGRCPSPRALPPGTTWSTLRTPATGTPTRRATPRGYVEAFDEVKAGQPLISFDRDAIAAAGHEDVVACVVSNPDAFQKIEHVGDSNTLLGDRPLVKLGDQLLVVRR